MNPRASTASPASSVPPLTNRRNYRDSSPHSACTSGMPHARDAFELVSLDEHKTSCNHTAQIDALTRRIAELEARLPIQNGQPSKFYQGVADGLWYLGHVIGIGSLLSRISLPAAAALVVTGQALTIASRPIGRLRERVRGASDDTA